MGYWPDPRGPTRRLVTVVDSEPVTTRKFTETTRRLVAVVEGPVENVVVNRPVPVAVPNRVAVNVPVPVPYRRLGESSVYSGKQWCTNQGGTYSLEGGFCYMPVDTCYSIASSPSQLEEASAYCRWGSCSSDSDCYGVPCNMAIGQCAVVYCPTQNEGQYKGEAQVECG